jgi:hypothetical protein
VSNASNGGGHHRVPFVVGAQSGFKQ